MLAHNSSTTISQQLLLEKPQACYLHSSVPMLLRCACQKLDIVLDMRDSTHLTRGLQQSCVATHRVVELTFQCWCSTRQAQACRGQMPCLQGS